MRCNNWLNLKVNSNLIVHNHGDITPQIGNNFPAWNKITEWDVTMEWFIRYNSSSWDITIGSI